VSRRPAAALLACLALGGAAACGGEKDNASFGKPGSTLRVGYAFEPTAAELSDQISLRRYARAHDVKVVRRTLPDAAAAVTALRRGDVDVVPLNTGQVFKAVNAGAPVVAVVAGKSMSEHVYVAVRPISTLGQLRGRKVGSQGPGSDSEALHQLALRKAGLTDDDVKKVTLPNSAARVAALASGRLEATVLVYEEYLRAASRIPGLRVLARFVDLHPHRIANVWLVTRSFASKHREALQTLVRDHLRSTTRLYTAAGRQDWLAAAARGPLKDHAPSLRARVYEYYRAHGMFPRIDQPITPAAYRRLAGQMVSAGQVPRAPAFEKVWDPSYWQHAARG
jgi:ABC-type nitrate/sulfonate/bicarbonate transport system substrate-binding protein